MKREALLRMAYLFVLQVFQGNTNQSTIVTNKLRQPILAQYIRVHAQQWYLGVCLRMEVYGCAAVSPIPFTPTVLIPPICSEFRLVSIIELFIEVSISVVTAICEIDGSLLEHSVLAIYLQQLLSILESDPPQEDVNNPFIWFIICTIKIDKYVEAITGSLDHCTEKFHKQPLCLVDV